MVESTLECSLILLIKNEPRNRSSYSVMLSEGPELWLVVQSVCQAFGRLCMCLVTHLLVGQLIVTNNANFLCFLSGNFLYSLSGTRDCYVLGLLIIDLGLG
jgi:hypothetical protein